MILMKAKYLGKMPQWYQSEENFDVVLSDDIDGLVSASALKYAKNWDVNYFYDFRNLYVSGKTYFEQNKSTTRVWVDVALLAQEKCFDNHISRKSMSDYRNNLCINPNLMTNVTNANYYSKYCGSTALVIWSTYNIPLPESEIGKMLLLAIDVTFKGFYANNNKFKERNKFYLCDVLDMPELYEVQQRHTSNDFARLIREYDITRKISLEGDNLQTKLNLKVIGELLGIDMVLPEKKFIMLEELETGKGNMSGISSVKDVDKNVATLAFTGRDYAVWSRVK